MGSIKKDRDCQVHKLLLIRHGETVDNVAGLYAGSRDSVLSNHGLLQTSRLGSYFAERKFHFDYVFSSTLARASKTADAIRNAQESDLEIYRLPQLKEQHFGYLEGQSTCSKLPSHHFEGQKSSGQHDGDSLSPRDIESNESLCERASQFLNGTLMPMLKGAGDGKLTIAIVSHGILLSALWKCMLQLQRPGTVMLKPEIHVDSRPAALEHIARWSNTGYLELDLGLLHPSESESTNCSKETSNESTSFKGSQFSITVCAINKRDHLSGLKRTRGGLGSSKYEEGQKSIDAFFKRLKTK